MANNGNLFVGKVAFVTGGASGIGRAAALAFARQRASVVVADVSDEGNQETARLIEKEGGVIIRMDDIGIRNLAYTILKKNTGHYVLFEIEGSGQEILELERRMRVNDLIIRFVTVRVDEDRKKADKVRAKREARQVKRASYRNAPAAEDSMEAQAEA